MKTFKKQELLTTILFLATPHKNAQKCRKTNEKTPLFIVSYAQLSAQAHSDAFVCAAREVIDIVLSYVYTKIIKAGNFKHRQL